MILGIDHIGLATNDPVAVGALLAVLGMERADAGVAEAYGVSCEFWRHAGEAEGPAVEIVSPIGEDSAVSPLLARSGPGLYHVALEVEDAEFELARLRGEGFVMVDREPCAGAREGMRVAFMYARRPAGLLIELVQYDRARPLSEIIGTANPDIFLER